MTSLTQKLKFGAIKMTNWRYSGVVAIILLFSFALKVRGATIFDDNFDSYTSDQRLGGQGGWSCSYDYFYVNTVEAQTGVKSIVNLGGGIADCRKYGSVLPTGDISFWVKTADATYLNNNWYFNLERAWDPPQPGLYVTLLTFQVIQEDGIPHSRIYGAEDGMIDTIISSDYFASWTKIQIHWKVEAYGDGGIKSYFAYKIGENNWSNWLEMATSIGNGVDRYLFFSGDSNGSIYFDSIGEAEPIIPPSAKPDFWIDKIRPVQVVWDSKIDDNDTIDLVAGKSTMVRVEVRMKDYEVLNKQELIEVKLTVPEPLDDFIFPKTYSFYRTIGQLEENSNLDLYLTAPIPVGDYTITAEVDPEKQIPEFNEDNNKASVNITVKDTNSLHLVYFPIDRPITYFGYGPINMEEYLETVSQSGKFIGATYPVAEEEFTNEKSDWKYYGDPVPYLGLIDDAISIWTRGELVTRTRADVSIGIVPEDYFRYHLIEETKGISLNFPGINGVLAEGGYWTAIAHEAGHRFGLLLDEEEYVTNPPGNRADGFWVGERREISNGVCFMGKAGANHSFSHGIRYDNRPIWIDNEDYKHLFKEFRVDKTDPDVLLMSGIISKDGTIQFGKLYMVENGTIDYIIPGNYSIQILDTSGQVLTNIPFYTSFKMYINPFGIIDTDFAGFTLTIPYPENTSKIQIQHDEEILIEINPNSKLLHDAVDLIPDYGFINNPEQRRNALHNKIEAAEKMIEQDNFKGAVNKLKFDIKDKLERWLVDDYQKENPEQLSKVEVIRLTQAIINRLSNR